MPVHVIRYAHNGSFNVAEMTVAQVAKGLRDAFNIPLDAESWIDGIQVSPDYILKEGDTLVFGKLWGRKGGLHDLWTEVELVELFGKAAYAEMVEAGLTLTPHKALTREQVSSWIDWSRNKVHPARQPRCCEVDVGREELTYNKKTYFMDRQMALVLECLLDANGEIRSQNDIKSHYPNEPFDDRLDLTINRKLMAHPSGIGERITSSTRGYRLV